MDDRSAGMIQARAMRRILAQARLEPQQVWLQYFALGGDAGETEVEAFLREMMLLPALQRDLLAHATNELLDHARGPRVPYTSDLLDRPTEQGTPGTGPEETPRPPQGPEQDPD